MSKPHIKKNSVPNEPKYMITGSRLEGTINTVRLVMMNLISGDSWVINDIRYIPNRPPDAYAMQVGTAIYSAKQLIENMQDIEVVIDGLTLDKVAQEIVKLVHERVEKALINPKTNTKTIAMTNDGRIMESTPEPEPTEEKTKEEEPTHFPHAHEETPMPERKSSIIIP